MRRRHLFATLLRASVALGLAAIGAPAVPGHAQLPPFQPPRDPDSRPADGGSSGPAAPGPAPIRPQAPTPPAASADAGSVPNNIMGLNVARLHQDRYIYVAADLVNANGGDWGYLTVVWTAQDRDTSGGAFLLQQFLDRCYEQHLQPIIRVSTRFDPTVQAWTRPEEDDAERWRAFLELANWPARRVWVIAGNEPNLGREWGGAVDAAGYAQYLSHFLDVFADSERFKVVNAPLDASNTTNLPEMQDDFEFLGEMDAAVPGIFERLPAWASNPYRVLHQGDDLRYTHLAYEAELAAIGRDMPVLITEAGHLDTGDDQEIANFYKQAFSDWMADPRVIAVTPLFWHPDRGIFWMFDFDTSGKMTYKSPTYDVIYNLPHVHGSPDFVTAQANVDRSSPATALARSSDAHSQSDPGPRPTANPGAQRELMFQIANTDGQGARLRAEPSRSARSLQVVPDGAPVEAVGPEQDGEGLRWRPVRTPDGTKGWIAASLLAPRDSVGTVN
jgi:hypothetical protein